MKKYSSLFFDLDDTLFDFQRSEKWALKRLIEDHGVMFTSQMEEVYKNLNSELWHRYAKGEISVQTVKETRFTKLFNYYAIQGDGIKADIRFRELLADGNFLLPDAKEIMEDLHKTYQLIAVTNGIADTQYARLQKTGLKPYFDQIFISGEIGSQKPEPAFFDAVFQKNPTLNKKEVLMIGDNLDTDILGGINYGLDTCWITQKSISQANEKGVNPTFLIKSLKEIYNII